MKAKFNILEIGFICIIFTFVMKQMWFTDPIPEDDKWSGFTGWSAMQYELRQAHYNERDIQIGAWIKFILNVYAQWLFMFSISCLSVIVGKQIIIAVRSGFIKKPVEINY